MTEFVLLLSLAYLMIGVAVVPPEPQPESKPPYGPWCRDRTACDGKGYCPLDPTCGD